MIQLQEVINFYLGCEFLDGNGNRYILKPQNLPSNWKKVSHPHKPILRKLSDITVDELREIVKIQPDVDHINIGAARSRFNAWCRGEITIGGSLLNHAEIFTYLIKQGFDLFGLIDSNQAIDAQTVKPTEGKRNDNAIRRS